MAPLFVSPWWWCGLLFILVHLLFPLNDAFTLGKQTGHGRNGQLYAAVQQEESSSPQSPRRRKTRRARDLMRSLIEEEKCYATAAGARALVDVCAIDVVYEDRFEPQPIVGKQALLQHLTKKSVMVRIDKISDGDAACGFCWTWVTEKEEGIRGTTFVQLNDSGEIVYVQEIPEPIFKPGNLTKDLLKTLTAGEEWPAQFAPFVPRPAPPQTAHELIRYLFVDDVGSVRDADPVAAVDELVRYLDDDVVYRDFNYEHVLRGPKEVRALVESFRLPGLTFRPLRRDDGVDSTCFTWEIVLADVPDTIHGISFYELDPATKKIRYVRDVMESAIKPPILGKWARQLRPALGIMQPVPRGSRPHGL